MNLTRALFIGAFVMIVSAALAGQTVEQWGVFELALRGPASGNPFLETSLSARFEQGTNSVEVNGFYDGDGVYRVRFMPEHTGTWSYQTTSNVRRLNGQSGSFTVQPPSTQNHGPVRVARQYHFAYADGTPYQELGTTCYVWEWQPEALQVQTLQTLATSPFNKIRFCVLPKHYVWNTNEPIMYPFPGGSARTNWDFTHFNVKYFQHLEQRVQDLAALGMEADIILFHPYDEGHWGFDRMPAEVDDRYLHYVVARLAAYHNVWWSLANEWDFMKRKKESDFVRFGEIVSHDDPYHHLLSIHQGVKLFNHNLSWITHASIQSPGAVQTPARARAYRDTYGKPVVYDEVQYEGNIPSGWGRLSAEELVFRFWNATIAGTYCGHGETFRSDDQVLWWSKGGVLKGQSPARLAFLKQVLQDAPAEGLDPIGGHPEMAGKPGSYYLVYLGKQALTNWDFVLPQSPTGSRPLVAGEQFTVDVLDTWNMSTARAPGSFTLKKNDDGSFSSRDGQGVALPGKPYLALRIKPLAN